MYGKPEWGDTLRYITGVEQTFHTSVEAREWLLRCAWEDESGRMR